MDDTSVKSKRKERNMWSVEAEELLLMLWSQNVDSLRGNRKNSNILQKMTQKMAAMGYPYTGYETRVKIHNLTNKYRRESKRVSEGLISSWPPYETVDKILRSYEPNFQKIGDNTHASDYFSSNPTPSEESDGDDYYEDINEQFELDEEEEVAEQISELNSDTSKPNKSESMKHIHNEYPKFNEPLHNERKYLHYINKNIELLIDLHKRSLAKESETNSILRQLISVIKNTGGGKSLVSLNDSRPRKKIKLSNSQHSMDDMMTHDDEYENSASYVLNEDPLDDENPADAYDIHSQEFLNAADDVKEQSPTIPRSSDVHKQLDIKIKEEFLKTKEMERQFLIEKHNLEMDILRLELEAKKKQNV